MAALVARAVRLQMRRWQVQAPLRLFCSADDELKYEEERQQGDIKSPAFYEEQGAQRRYFYYVDLLVRVLL